jgi:TPR repeat protein
VQTKGKICRASRDPATLLVLGLRYRFLHTVGKLTILCGVVGFGLLQIGSAKGEVLDHPQINGHGSEVPEILREARRGDSKAQLDAGKRYLLGIGVRRDYSRALEWLSMAAAQGSPEADHWMAWMYSEGWGTKKDDTEATRLYRSAAEMGYAPAQYAVGSRYAEGIGTSQNLEEAVKWYVRAAEQGYQFAMITLAHLYRDGDGVPIDLARAHLWFNVAALSAANETDSDASAKERDRLISEMSPKQLASAQKMATDLLKAHPALAEWKVGAVPNTSKPDPTHSDEQVEPRSTEALQLVSTGSGFLVSRAAILTNAHVVDGCTAVFVQADSTRSQVLVLAEDVHRDLAVVGTVHTPRMPLSLSRTHIRQGQTISVVGYPLRGILSSAPNFTTGIVSAVTGIRNDFNEFQITAPVQPGNSGGPVLDEGGNVVGIVSSKLNAFKVVADVGTFPENVNFAIQGSAVADFLDSNGFAYNTSPSNVLLKTTKIAERVRPAVFVVECWQ